MNQAIRRKYADTVMVTLFLWAPAFSGIYFSILGQNLNIERLLFLALLLPLIYYIIIRTVFTQTTSYSPSILVLALWNISLLLSSYFSESTASHLQGIVICAIPTLIAAYLATHPNIEDISDKTSLKIVLYLSIGGVISYFIAPYLPSSISQMIIGNTSNDKSVKFTTIEPNIFGSTLTFFLLLSLHKLNEKKNGFAIITLAIFAIFLSFSRGPYAALIAGLLVYFVFSGTLRHPSKLLSACVFVFLVLFFTFPFWGYIYPYIEGTINREGTLQTRYIVNSYALDRFSESPLVGNGPLDFSESMGFVASIVGSTDARQISISQMFIGILHDSGIFGLSIYLVFLAYILSHGVLQCLKGDAKRRASYLAGFVSIVVASQATTIHYTALFGIATGLLASRSRK
ncbi:O-antigen ligase family protein [Pseudorhodobacter sp. W20_MBD10_FR17]|uniref:O-antigen ligase family protein n=1 Tax=Pseudorhodobacter sp. W20_MBD10_FR17 TaxID=3240266 RepID=UPI003F95A394